MIRYQLRKLLMAAAVIVVLAVPMAASTATKTVRITSARFEPFSVTVTAGDRVVWKNVDSKRHQVVADDGSFASPILDANKTYAFTFREPGTFRYHDGLYPGHIGKVVVQRAPAVPTISLAASEPVVRYGQSTMLSGAVSTKRAGETVTIFARPVGDQSFVQLTTALTDANGTWGLAVTPAIETQYMARSGAAASTQVRVQVRPRVRLLLKSRSRFLARVLAARTFGGRWLVLQRRSPAGWIAVRVLKLGPSGSRVFTIPHRRGVSRYRLYLNPRQAGDGYLPAWSGTQRVVRR
jgi:plastocyanin